MVATHNSNLSHSYTLFAESEKKGATNKRGRFNLGEKLVLSLCETAEISSTKGTVIFDHEGRRTTRARRQAGTEFTALLRMTREELAEALSQTPLIIPPDAVETFINGQRLEGRKPLLTYRALLKTEVANQNGLLTRPYQSTLVNLYTVKEGERSMLYEMGIPIMDLGDDPYHVDIQQKVPMSMERDAVTPYWLRELRGTVLDKSHHLLTETDARGKWAAEGLEVSDDHEAIKALVSKRFGDRAVIADPSDREGENMAKAQGYTVIPGGSFTADGWARIKAANAALPAGQVTPSPKPFSPGGAPLKMIDVSDWTTPMHAFRNFVLDFASHVAQLSIHVEFTRDRQWKFNAAYSKTGAISGTVIFNLALLPPTFLTGPVHEQCRLLIHELGHHWGHHLEESYHEALCKLGALGIEFALNHKERFLSPTDQPFEAGCTCSPELRAQAPGYHSSHCPVIGSDGKNS
jgi:hypothetical protein